MLTPLEQFEVLFFPLFDLSFFYTNSFIFIFFIISLTFILLYIYYRNGLIIPKRYQLITEILFSFSRRLVVENIGKNSIVYFPYIFLIFIFILFSNFIGMVPYTFTVTSHLITTFTIAFFSFVGINIIGVLKHGKNFLSLFLPNGSPLIIAPFLVGVEFISYIARVFSLSIRLFANMMSGHTLLKILSGFAWSLFWALGIGSLMFFALFFVIVIVTGLELAIAFLQAYVFSILICLYINDALHLH